METIKSSDLEQITIDEKVIGALGMTDIEAKIASDLLSADPLRQHCGLLRQTDVLQ